MQTIAVLPFADMSPNKDQEYFSDGLAEELLNVLARNPQLRVTSRTSAFSFKGKDLDIKTIAAKLNVQHILEGSVRKYGNQIRITAQLIDVETDAHLWSKTYDGKFDNIFAVQDTISLSVAAALQVTLLGDVAPAAQKETNPQAYNAFLQGEHFRKLRGKENSEKAISFYEQALAIDPGYALAWTGLSDVHSWLAGIGYMPLEEAYAKARQEAQKALTLDPNLAEAHRALAQIKKSYDWDWSGADASYQRALALAPGNANALWDAGDLAAKLGRFEEALALSGRAIELDPVSTSARYFHGHIAWSAGRMEIATVAFRQALELNPQFPSLHMRIGRIYLIKGMPDSALAEIEMEVESGWQKYGLALAYYSLDRKKEADDMLAVLLEEFKNDGALQIAQIYAWRGETDQAFAWLERAYQQRDGGLAGMQNDPLLRRLEKDPRYAAFVKKMKLPR